MADPKLAAYRAKRDFNQTAEPSGDRPAPGSKRLRFVIQKHDATRLHYDFRLEYEGVLLSWAVTRGPSVDPADKRLAVEVEPHPIPYGDFEGTIPKGQYGGGAVMLWDRGYWGPEGMTVAEGLKKGDLKFTLDGARLKGSWVLVRMKHDRDGGKSKRNNWLLIKHRDEWARDGEGEAFLEANAASVASGRSLEEIAAGEGKGPTPFFTAKPKTKAARSSPARVWNSNRGDPEASAEAVASKDRQPPPANAAKGKRAAALPDFIPPQLTQAVDRPPSGDAWAHEIKFDGYRMQLRVEDGRTTLKTRKGLDWTHRFKEIAADAAGLGDAIVDGEIVALDDHGAPDFPALQAALSSGRTGGLVFYVFDLLFQGREDLRPLPLRDRKARLQALTSSAGDGGRIRFVDHFETGGEAVLKSACRMHLEGIISKRLDSPYVSGRSDTWTKAKCRGGQEVVVAGWTSEGASQFRSLIAGVHRDGRLVHVGRIGTGFSRDKVAEILPRLRAVETGTSPFEGPGAPRKAAGVHWVKPVLVAEIESGGWTGDGNLRQASFKALREDKPAEEVVQEVPAPVETVERAASEEKAKPAKVAPARPAPTGKVVMGVTLSNPDKVLWPAADGEPAHTKRDLALYYEAMAEALLPHIRGRPCSIIRCPDGVGGQGFFQRHIGQGASSLVTAVTVFGDKSPYLQIDRPEALVAMAQTGALELHPWNCMPDRPEVPGRLVFDLDPAPGVDFARVIEGALEVKARLEALGLAAFCKTTGGKGLHVVAPLAAEKGDPLTWPEAKGFARDLCTAMAAAQPERYLVNMAKAKREGRIFLDYLRNDRMATAVAPYSPRARSGAPVSWPLEWKAVKSGLDPKAFTLRTAPALWRKNRAWADYDVSARPLRAAAARLAKAGKA
ncbi:MAG TPA: DNA ligase D [Caulobacteraceae bacterium]|nr:DNA ligase D [Caulobacteraceae bacterium]